MVCAYTIVFIKKYDREKLFLFIKEFLKLYALISVCFGLLSHWLFFISVLVVVFFSHKNAFSNLCVGYNVFGRIKYLKPVSSCPICIKCIVERLAQEIEINKY